jgi:2-phosphosulfolactate phosphatase
VLRTAAKYFARDISIAVCRPPAINACTMKVDVLLHPRELKPEHLTSRAVAVFDVLRATTTLTNAIANGATEVRCFESLDDARDAASKFTGPKLLCGERHTLPPPGFDLGNSPGDYTSDRVKDRTIFFSTTNGTRAINAVLSSQTAPKALFAAALINASAAAQVLFDCQTDITLLCSGSDGQFSAEDFLGAGAVADALAKLTEITPGSDATLAARFAFSGVKSDLPSALRQTYGGHNNLRVGLAADIDFAARLDVSDVVARIIGSPPTARRL